MDLPRRNSAGRRRRICALRSAGHLVLLGRLWSESLPARADEDAPPASSSVGTPESPPPPLEAIEPAQPSSVSAPGEGSVPALLPSLRNPHVVYRRRYNLIFLGASLLASTWIADRLFVRDLSPSPVSWLPLVGPWYLVHVNAQQPAASGLTTGLLVVDGLLQLGGTTVSVLGIVIKEKRLATGLVQPAAAVAAPTTGL